MFKPFTRKIGMPVHADFYHFPHLGTKKCLLKKLFPTLLTSFFGVCYTAFRGVLEPVKLHTVKESHYEKIACIFVVPIYDYFPVFL